MRISFGLFLIMLLLLGWAFFYSGIGGIVAVALIALAIAAL